MSNIIDKLSGSSDPLENDLARVYLHWQDMKRKNGKIAGLGYEPRDINLSDAKTVIASRVLKASAGFEEVDPEQSYEAIVLRYPEQFEPAVITAAQKRLSSGTSKLDTFKAQDIQFFIKTSAIDLFGEKGVGPSPTEWLNRRVSIPELLKEDAYADPILENGFCGLIWLHTQEIQGERGQGLTALVRFSPISKDRKSTILEVEFFERAVGKEFLDSQKDKHAFIGKVHRFRHTKSWPIDDESVSVFLDAVRAKVHLFSAYDVDGPNPDNLEDLTSIENETALRQVVLRRYQAAFRKALLRQRPNCCAITGTTEVSVLDAAHIVPYSERFADRDEPTNGILLRTDIHKLFDAHLISIDPESRSVVVSKSVVSPDYLSLQCRALEDDVSVKSLAHHFERFMALS